MGGGRKQGLGKPPCSNQLEFPIESPGRAESSSPGRLPVSCPHTGMFMLWIDSIWVLGFRKVLGSPGMVRWPAALQGTLSSLAH